MLGPLAFIALPLLGIALLWAVHLIYTGRQSGRDEPLQFILVTIAWLMIIVGLIAPMIASFIGWGLIIAMVIILLMAVVQYRASERRALLWMLGASAERGLPLHVAARAFAAERSDAVGRGALRLAEQLELGVPLPDALQQSGNRLPPDAAIATRLAYETGGVAQGMLETARLSAQRDRDWRPLFEKLMYFIMLGLVAIGILTFLMIKVVPAFEKIFSDFDTELPQMTQVTVSVSRGMASFGWLFLLLIPAMLFVMVFGAIAYVALPTWEFQRIPYHVVPWWVLPGRAMIFWCNMASIPMRPLAAWLMKPYHRATILDSLARTVEAGHALSSSLALLARWYPQPQIRRRLAQANERTAAGQHWCDALIGQRLVSRGDAAVLRAAERVGNLPWAMREVSLRGWRRVQTRTVLLNNVVMPLTVLAIAAPISFLVISLFLPLIKLIQTLS